MSLETPEARYEHAMEAIAFTVKATNFHAQPDAALKIARIIKNSKFHNVRYIV